MTKDFDYECLALSLYLPEPDWMLDGVSDRVDLSYLFPPDVQSVRAAFRFAAEMHYLQYYGKEPYINHVLGVVNRLAEDRQPAYILIAGALHDVCEDTDLDSYEDIFHLFGGDVSGIISLLTNLPGERYDDYIYYIQGNRGAEIVKIADLLENIHQATRSIDEVKPYRYLLIRWMKAYIRLAGGDQDE